METNTANGLNKTSSKNVSQQLNILLANYQIFYINTRGFHWNITGEKFFELHAKFEELYNNLVVKIDEIAERILTLGHTPLHSFSDYIKTAELKEATNVSGGKEAVTNVVTALNTLVRLQREILADAQQHNDEGTAALMSDYIREQEKMLWMYNAYLK